MEILAVNPSENELRKFPQMNGVDRRRAEKKVKIGAWPRFPEEVILSTLILL